MAGLSLGGFFGWIILGGIAGWIASMIKGKNAQMGIVANIGAGIVGGLLGGWILMLFGIRDLSIFWSFLTAIAGAVLLLTIINMVRK